MCSNRRQKKFRGNHEKWSYICLEPTFYIKLDHAYRSVRLSSLTNPWKLFLANQSSHQGLIDHLVNPKTVMKRTVFILLALVFPIFTWAQDESKIHQKIAQRDASGIPFIMQSVLSFDSRIQPEDQLQINDGYLFKLNKQQLNTWNESRSEAIRMELPLDGEEPMSLKLVEYDLLTDDFQVSVSSLGGGTHNYTPGRYYHGVVDGDATSVVAISVFEDQVMGVIETAKDGNMIFGPVKGDEQGRYVLYRASDYTEELPFQCGSDKLTDQPKRTLPEIIPNPESVNLTTNCVRAYLECDYDMFLEKGSVANVVNHMTGLFNVVALLYSNDNMNTTVSEVFVWDSPDPYATGSTVDALVSFRNYRTSYNGDVAHLVSRGAPTGGGVAWVDVLCSTYGYAYSYIYSGYNAFPTYSWSVNVIAHEMGHNLGAAHTHDCSWTVNGVTNQAIDGCGDAAGYGGNGNCPTAPVPTSGTVMSYCHLVGGVGIDFNEGFHPIVASVLQAEIDGAGCLSPCTTCGLAVSVSTNNVNCNGGNNGSATANPSGGTPPYTYAWSNGSNTQSISGLTAGTYTVTVTDADNCVETQNAIISQPAAINLSTTVINESFPGNGDGAIDLTVAGGSSPYSYAWSNGANTQDINGLIAATYTVTVTDNNGCVANTSATVNSEGCNVIIDSYPYDESFEGGLGDWNQESNDDIDWTRNSGGTPSSSTGPSAAYDGSFYMYTEASGTNNNKTAILESPCFDMTVVNNPEFSFAYHMYGSDMGSLTLEVSTNNGGSWSTLWTESGDQGDQWLTASIPVDQYITTNTIFRFVGITGNSFRSDMAIDGISISENVPPCSPPSLSMSGSGVSCNGGSDGSAAVNASGGVQPYAYSWSTGSTSAQINNLSAGTYTVTVTDAAGCTAEDNYTVAQPSAISLSFSVTNETVPGAEDGAVNLSVAGGIPGYSYSWSNGETTQDISNLPAGSYTVTVTDNNSCEAIGSATVEVTTCDILVNTFPYEMNLESGFGDWEQDNTDELDWTRYSGSTPSNGTGPSSAFEGNFYMYTEASGSNRNKVARLISPCFDLSGLTNPEVSFAYHMYGRDMGMLSLQVSLDNGNSWTTIWTESDNQGNQWLNANVDLTSYQSPATKLRFAGLTGDGFRSDMAVDDIVIDGTIPPCNAPSLSFSSTNVSCPGGNNGSATVTASGGTAPYTYLWSTGATTSSISSLTAGTYDVTVTDNVSCPATGSVTISEPGAINLSFAVTNETFAGANDGAIDLTVAGGNSPYTYSWDTGATTEDISGLSAREYFVTVTDNNGCSQNGSATVIVNPSCTPLASYPYFESYENNFGLWIQDPGDNFDWTRRSGSTPSNRTGPNSASNGNFYIYTEATGNQGTAIIEGPCVDLQTATNPVISFDYHMYGRDMGILELEISTDGGATWSTYWTESGDQGNQWRTHSSSLSAYSGQTVKFRFLGTLGGGFRSDMAIDAFSIDEAGNLPAQSTIVTGGELEITALYPNPAIDQLTIAFSSSSDTRAEWIVTDKLGRQVKKGSWEVQRGIQEYQLPVDDMHSGYYFLTIIQDIKHKTERFIIQK